MSVNVSPFGPKPQFELSSGAPAVGGLLFFYVAGSTSTKQNTYTDSTGLVANTNPIVLDALGMPTTTQIWFTAGLSYKAVYAPAGDTDPPSSPIWSIDNLKGVNDTTSTFDEWNVATLTPTFVSTTSFTLAGDQTTEFQKNRRVKSTNSGGTVYSTITNSVFAALTTVTVVNDGAGVLDAGLSAVSLGVLRAINNSIPIIPDTYPFRSGSSDVSKLLAVEVDALTTATTRKIIATDRDMSMGVTARAMQNVSFKASVNANALLIELKTEAGNDPSTVDPAMFYFRSATAGTGTVTQVKVTAALSVTVPSTGTLGTVSAQASRVWVGVINNAGTAELAVFNAVSGTAIAPINEGAVITTTIITAPNSAQTWYSAAARTSVPFMIGACIDSTQATAGTWATTPAAVVTNPVDRPGKKMQDVSTETGAVATATTATPFDDTIPQKTEGDTLYTQAITPIYAGNVLKISFVTFISSSGTRDAIVSLLQDTTANALLATVTQIPSSALAGMELLHKMIAGTAAATTFKIMVGLDTATATLTVNGTASARLFGGVANTYFSIEEYSI